MEFRGKRVVVTAGGGGIGAETTRLFSEAGANVFICDIDEASLNETISKNDNVQGIKVDVSDPEAFRDFFRQADEFLGGLDIMVNNAGTAGPTALIEDISLEEWHNCLNINLTSAFLGTQLAIPRIKESDNLGGSIINLSSAAGKFGFPPQSLFSSKMGYCGIYANDSFRSRSVPNKMQLYTARPGRRRPDRSRDTSES